MTDHTTETPLTAPAGSLSAPRPYACPTVTPLGSVGALTAGNAAGTLDTLVGGTGGFQDPDPTS